MGCDPSSVRISVRVLLRHADARTIGWRGVLVEARGQSAATLLCAEAAAGDTGARARWPAPGSRGADSGPVPAWSSAWRARARWRGDRVTVWRSRLLAGGMRSAVSECD